MPAVSVDAHYQLDAAYVQREKFTGNSNRVALLFELYQQIASPLESRKATRRKRMKP